MSSAPTFGKRNAPRPLARIPGTPVAVATASADHAAFFAAARRDLDDTSVARPVVVPRSFKAAFLAGLIVGCALAGFDVTGHLGASRVEMVEQMIGLKVDTSGFLPVLILIGLVNGARIAAISVMGVHTLLALLGQSSRWAYALGGAVAALVVAALALALGVPVGHGWPIDALAGAGAGFLYRVLAGARPA